jgi:GNAT superfamily N-acetyltransferase
MTMSEEILIRAAEPKDAARILACLGEAFEPYRGAYTAGAFADTVPSPMALQERFGAMRIFVATTAAGEVVGTISCSAHGDEGHLRGMAVRPPAQGQAIAARLLARAEEALLELGCGRVTLDTTAPLERAMRFYERRGYVRSGRVSDFFGMELFEFVKPLRR